MFPMIVALLIAIAAAGSVAYAMPNPLPGEAPHPVTDGQEQLGTSVRSLDRVLDQVPEAAKTPLKDNGDTGHEDLVAPTAPSPVLVPEDRPQSRLSPAISSTTAVTLTETISDVLKLADDPLVSGESYRGLLAKLEAAERALDRGQAKVAINLLDAFHNQLNAFRRSGHITAQNYDDLLSRYSALVASLGGVARERTEPNHRSDSGAGANAAASPSHPSEGPKTGQANPRRPEDKGPKPR